MTKLFNEIFDDLPLTDLSSMGEGNIIFNHNKSTYLLSTFKSALLKFKPEKDLTLTEEWFDEIELLTAEQMNLILDHLP